MTQINIAPNINVDPDSQRDPLPSWNNGIAKRRIIEFVTRITHQNSPDFVPVSERFATFDNDGTLWPERPAIQILFILRRLEALVNINPSLKEKQPLKAALEHDFDYFLQEGEKAVMELVVAAQSNMTEEEYEIEAREFIETAVYPRLNQHIPNLPYLPMVELLDYLRANSFQTWICSGGDLDFMRVFSEQLYGISRQKVIGSTVTKDYDEQKRLIWRNSEIDRINDEDGKPIGIDRYIGQRPIFAMGNVRSGGDIAMLSYSQGRPGPSLQLIINHDDAQREFAYQEKDNASLNAASANNWTVVSMRDDWKTIFSF